MTLGIVIPVLNQLTYTRQCLDSLNRCGPAQQVQIAVVNNASTDGTAEYLDAQDGLIVIHNQQNRGCAASWNQGVEALKTPWTVLLNNDVLVPAGWLEGLLEFAAEREMAIVSPAIREGELNYDFQTYARDFVRTMKDVERPGVASGICFMVHQQVFDSIGGFDENFRIGVFEDADFLWRARLGGFGIGTTGRSFIHHFGSMTQRELRHGPPDPYEKENRAYFRCKWRLHWARRRWMRLHSDARALWWRTRERRRHGHTLNEKWINGKLRYC